MPEYLKIDDYEKSWQIILASCSLPFMFKPVVISGKKYMDGGCSDPLPVKFAQNLGSNKLIAVLTREKSYKKQNDSESKFSSFFFRKNENFAKVLKKRSKIYNESKEYLFNKEKEGTAFVFAPECTKTWKRTERNTNILMAMYQEGYNDALKRMEELKKFVGNNDSVV